MFIFIVRNDVCYKNDLLFCHFGFKFHDNLAVIDSYRYSIYAGEKTFLRGDLTSRFLEVSLAVPSDEAGRTGVLCAISEADRSRGDPTSLETGAGHGLSTGCVGLLSD